MLIYQGKVFKPKPLWWCRRSWLPEKQTSMVFGKHRPSPNFSRHGVVLFSRFDTVVLFMGWAHLQRRAEGRVHFTLGCCALSVKHAFIYQNVLINLAQFPSAFHSLGWWFGASFLNREALVCRIGLNKTIIKIKRRHRKYQPRAPKIFYRTNHKIMAPNVRVVGEGIEASVYPLQQAIGLAKSKGLDLV